MITFSYQARDGSGNIVSGIQDALNEDNAVTSLMSRGLMVLSLQQKAAASRQKNKYGRSRKPISFCFTRQLATMIEAGISLVQAMTALYEQCDPKRQKALRHVISDVTARVQGGETFQRIYRETSARFRSTVCQHGQSGRSTAVCSRRFSTGWRASSKPARDCARRSNRP